MKDGIPSELAAGDAFRREQYDKALEILETREGYYGQMRKVIASILCDRRGLRTVSQRQSRLARHRSLLDISELRSPDDRTTSGYRLVTTNFDNRFELAGLDLALNEDGPRLRPPAHDRPSGVVHLHGRITKHDQSHSDLVLTTRDFGNAYLRHGWAARFVVELFREFTVLFIGYSLSDPVMRYLMDVFATERGALRQFKPAYALVSFDGRKENDRQTQKLLWEAKRVEPILYDESHQLEHPHSLLDDTLVAWAAERRAGLTGRLGIATGATMTGFTPGTDDTDPLDVLSSVVWALDTADGDIARRFAEQERSPDISWFGAIVSKLPRQRVEASDDRGDPDGTIARPANIPDSKIAQALAGWACRNLESDTLIHAITAAPELVYPEFLDLIATKLQYNPESIAEPYRKYWQLLLKARISSRNQFREAVDNLPTLPIFLAELTPRIDGPRPIDRWFEDSPPAAPTDVQDLGRFEVVHKGDFALAATELHRNVVQLGNSPPSELIDAVDSLSSILGAWAELAAWIELPITGRSRARRYLIRERDSDRYDTQLDILVDLIMAGFAGLAASRPGEASTIAARWRLLGSRAEHTLFTRLWLWAAAEFGVVDPDEVIKTLIESPTYLWGIGSEPEVLRFVRLRVGQAGLQLQAKLGATLMRTPPVKLFPEYLKGKELKNFIADRRSLRLYKAALGRARFKGPAARSAALALTEWEARGALSTIHEIEQQIDPSELARLFPEPEPETVVGKPVSAVIDAVRVCRSEWDRARLVEGIIKREPIRTVEILEALWESGFSERQPYSGIFWGLRSLAQEGNTTADLLEPIARIFAGNTSLADLCLDGAEDWLKQLADTHDTDELWHLWDLLAALERNVEPTDQDDERPFDTALNAVGGSLAEALIASEGRLGGLAGRGLSERHRQRFERLVTDNGATGVHARVILAMHFHWMYAIDSDWTESRMLSRLKWTWPNRAETIRLWRTFAFRPRSGPTLMGKIAESYVDALRHRDDLGENAYRSLCTLFGMIVTVTPTLFDHERTVLTLREVGVEGCRQVLRAFRMKMVDAGDSAAILWRERVGPWLRAHWPVDRDYRIGALAHSAIEVSLTTHEAFPEALALIDEKFDLTRVDDSYGWLYALDCGGDNGKFDYLAKFPAEVGRLILTATIRKSASFARIKILEVIKRVGENNPNLSSPEWEKLKIKYG